MLKTAFVVAALAAGLSLGATADRAAAVPSATPTQLGLANADAGAIQKAAVVCGRWRCRRVWRGARVWVGPVARSTALPALVGVGVLLGDGAVRDGAARDGVGRLIAMAGA